jgi:hypothetical protein
MMDHKTKTKAYYGVIGFLTLTLVLGLLFSAAAPWNRNQVEKLIRGMDRMTIQEVRLGNDTQLLRSDEAWLLELGADFIPTRAGAVEGFLDKIFTADILQDLGQDDEILVSSGLSNPKFLSLLGQDGEEIFRLEVGNLREDGRGSYVRLPGNNPLWIDQNIPGEFSKTINQWANLSIFDGAFEMADVLGFQFNSPVGLLLEEDLVRSFSLELNESRDGWIPGGDLVGKEIDFDRTNSKLANFARLSGREVGLSTEQAFSDLSHSLIVNTTKGQFTLSLGDLQDRGQPVQIGNRRFWIGQLP